MTISARRGALKLAIFLALVIAAPALLFAEERPPNIVFVLADDLGWAELGCYGNTFNETPHLDQMAQNGMRFTQAYAAAPVCSPYRAAFLSGMHPARLGIADYLRPNSANRLPTEILTLPEKLKGRGYATGMIGKWHLTGYRHHDAEHETRPSEHGFDWNFGSEVKGVGNGSNTWPYVFRSQPIRWIDIPNNRLGETENLTDRLNLEAIEFIERNRATPFFLYLAHYAPHTILNGRPDLVAKYRQKHAPGESGRTNCYVCEDTGLGDGDPDNHWAVDHNPHLAAMLEGIDDGIGKIRSKLEELTLLNNTIFIFTSDNGGESNITSNAQLRGGKSQLYEGGIRVPLIVHWPTNIDGSTIQEHPTMNTDFYPTLLEAAGIEPERNIDGKSHLANWKGHLAPSNRTLYWHYPLDRDHFLGGFSGGAIRAGNWKLIEKFHDRETELYRLDNDHSERNDLSLQEPTKVRELQSKLADWRERISARTPSPPLLTEASRLYFSDHFSGRASERLWYNSDWIAEEGILKRLDTGTKNTRIFLRNAAYQEALIRFDFQLQNSKDIRMLTGSHGAYNAVVHIRPDHFYIQTAKDESGPFYSYRHGECAYEFEPDRWYTMTVEIIGNQMVAHIDQEHVAYATHPILVKDRTYFALQADGQSVAFDNIQIFAVRKHRHLAENLKHIESLASKHPVEKSLEDEYRIRKTNGHEQLYQRHTEYRKLVKDLGAYDELKKKRFPEAFRSPKEQKKAALKQRRSLKQEDPTFNELLKATHRTKRALDSFLIDLKPELEAYPNSRKKAALERLRQEHRKSAGYQLLETKAEIAQQALEAAYPQAFITDNEINRTRKAEKRKLKNNSIYQELQQQRAVAYRAQQAYLHAHTPGLAASKEALKTP